MVRRRRSARRRRTARATGTARASGWTAERKAYPPQLPAAGVYDPFAYGDAGASCIPAAAVTPRTRRSRRAAVVAIAWRRVHRLRPPPPATIKRSSIDLDRRYTYWSLRTKSDLCDRFRSARVRRQLAELFSADAGGVDDALARASATSWPRCSRRRVRRRTSASTISWFAPTSKATGGTGRCCAACSATPASTKASARNGIFSIVKRQYASDDVRVRDAIGRLRACPRVLTRGRSEPHRYRARVRADRVGRRSRRRLALHDDARRGRARRVARNAAAELRAADAGGAGRRCTRYRAWLEAHMSSSTPAALRSGRSNTIGICGASLLLPFDSDRGRVHRTARTRPRSRARSVGSQSRRARTGRRRAAGVCDEDRVPERTTKRRSRKPEGVHRSRADRRHSVVRRARFTSSKFPRRSPRRTRAAS